MSVSHPFHESTPLTQADCLLVLARKNKEFDFPEHFHREYELNLIVNAEGAQRIVGDHRHIISDLELVLIGPNLPHVWKRNVCKNVNVKEYTIQFHRELFSDDLLQRKALHAVQQLLHDSSQGVAFSKEVILAVYDKICELAEKSGFDAFIQLMEILHVLSKNRSEYTVLSSIKCDALDKRSLIMNTAYSYIENHFHEKITLQSIASFLHMTEITFSRIFKQKTAKTFVEFLHDYRLQHACRLLKDTQYSISEISLLCGFNNQSHFNRLFKAKIKCTPREYAAISSDVSVV
ncbi:MAG: AraC family transcriptional regulator [Bacteroidales bacterium]|nr:AraC family transcriptional regulator [Bacteroidales bacterium]NLK82256.1 AraC family transcriptional regulator [Bacteroidales bacterium]HPY82513.1 AraC family transcriptional regulator [Bacteroidales bacterium]